MTADAVLDAAILAAHESGDAVALVDLYSQAADAAPDLDTRCFFWTYAYIFALELGLDAADGLAAKLRGAGRL